MRKAGYGDKLELEYVERKEEGKKKRNRGRRITWFNPPFSITVRTDVGKEFLRILDECFPRGHPLYQIMNRGTVKISYSCMPSMDRRIKSINVGKLRVESRKEEGELGCRCRKECPMEGRCRESELVYRAKVNVRGEDGEMKEEKSYIGLTSTPFIERFRNHNYSFNRKGMQNATELSKYVWGLKEEGKEYDIKWEILRKSYSYKPGAKYCNLCTSEALAIAFQSGSNGLNSKSEILKKCRHKTRWKLDVFKKF